MTTTNRTTATAADFEPYVAELRAEGMSDADVLVRYFKQARPEGEVDTNGDDAFLILRSAGILLYFTPTTDRHNPFEVGVEDDYGVQTFDWSEHPSLESALAWLANQLAERCPVASVTTHEMIEMAIEGTAEDAATIRFDEAAIRSLPRKESMTPDQIAGDLAEAARIRRMFAIAEPEEVA